MAARSSEDSEAVSDFPRQDFTCGLEPNSGDPVCGSMIRSYDSGSVRAILATPIRVFMSRLGVYSECVCRCTGVSELVGFLYGLTLVQRSFAASCLKMRCC